MAKKRHFIKRNRFFMAMVLLFSLYIGTTLVRQEFKIHELRQEEKEVAAQLEALHGEIGILKEDLKTSQSLEFSEKIAREKLKMVMPDEIVYILKEPEAPAVKP